MIESTTARPADVCRSLLNALEAAEGQTRRRKRDQGPDRIGLGLRRELLERAVEDDPPADGFEAWLLEQVVSASAGGPVRAMCAQILDEYRMARMQGEFGDWLRAGAPSDDALPGARDAGGDASGEDHARGPARERMADVQCPICRNPSLRDV